MRKKLCSLALAAALVLAAAPHTHAEGPLPDLGCTSAILIEKETGTVLAQVDPDRPLEPASVTKVMTLLLVMDALDSGQLAPDELVTVSANAAGMGGSQVFLKEGEQMPVLEMVKCVTVVSANDCAVALAEHLAGSEAAFVEQMNQKAAELGMDRTRFVNCTGLPAPDHLTTARDISLMSRALLLTHPDIRAFTTIWMDSIRDGTFGLTNTNRLIRFYPGATGLKTGSTSGALYCMAASAERDGMELIAVVMRSPTTAQRFEDAKALLDYGFANFAMVNVWPEEPLPPVDVLMGTQAQVQPVLEQNCRLLVGKGERDKVETELVLSPNVEAPVEKGQILGRLEVSVSGELRNTINIVAAQGVDRLTVPGIFNKMMQKLLLGR